MCSHVYVLLCFLFLSFYCTYLSLFSLLLPCISVNKGLYMLIVSLKNHTVLFDCIYCVFATMHDGGTLLYKFKNFLTLLNLSDFHADVSGHLCFLTGQNT